MAYTEYDCAPTDESCIQVRANSNYVAAMREQAARLVKLLESRYADRPHDIHFSVASCGHDFGDYLEIRCHHKLDSSKPYWFHIDSTWPRTWDEAATPCPYEAVTEDE